MVIERLPDEDREAIALAVTDGFIRAAYGLRGSGQLSGAMENMLAQWEYTSPVTGLRYGPEK